MAAASSGAGPSTRAGSVQTKCAPDFDAAPGAASAFVDHLSSPRPLPLTHSPNHKPTVMPPAKKTPAKKSEKKPKKEGKKTLFAAGKKSRVFRTEHGRAWEKRNSVQRLSKEIIVKKGNHNEWAAFDSLQAFWPALQVLAGDVTAAAQTQEAFASLWTQVERQLSGR